MFSLEHIILIQLFITQHPPIIGSRLSDLTIIILSHFFVIIRKNGTLHASTKKYSVFFFVCLIKINLAKTKLE